MSIRVLLHECESGHAQARTQPLSKGGYIIVEWGGGGGGGGQGQTFDCVLGGSGGMLPQKILEI